MEITKADLVKGGVGLVTGGPLGAVLSPIVGRAVMDRTWAWALIGVVAGPMSWVISTLPIALMTYEPEQAKPPAAVEEAPSAPAPDKASQPPEMERIPGERVPEQPIPVAATQPPPQAPPPPAPAPVAAAPTNTTVSDNLNAADGMFRNDMDGCANVSIAITAANNPNIYGPTSAQQKAELRRYAERCNLRF